MTSSATCSDGIWLNGRSNPASASNSAPDQPEIAGRSKLNRSGNARNTATHSSCAYNSRRACTSSSRLLVQTKSDTPYSRSIDQYGTIVHAMKGTLRSQSKTTTGT